MAGFCRFAFASNRLLFLLQPAWGPEVLDCVKKQCWSFLAKGREAGSGG